MFPRRLSYADEVNGEFPTVTVVIPARPGKGEVQSVASARALDYEQDQLEIIVARGRQPAVQRNVAVKDARGEVIYFLDDDAQPAPGNLRQAAAQFRDPKVQMVGGPNLCPPGAPLLEQVFAVVLASFVAFATSRARYARIGRLRESGEKELILCNLMVRREAFLAAGGFDELLYPNEENALMDELKRRGGKLLYDPDLVVFRRPRPTLGAFARMLFRYGRGRAEQFRLHPTPGSVLNFVPPLFCVYLLSLLPLLLLAPSYAAATLMPLVLYGIVVMIETLLGALGRHGWKSLLALPLVVLTHVLYGIGFWCGLFTRLPDTTAARQEADVELEHLTNLR